MPAAPRYLRCDNGPEFVSDAVLDWLSKAHVDSALNESGKRWQNGADESFNGKFRDERQGPGADRIQNTLLFHQLGSRSQPLIGPKIPEQVGRNTSPT